MSDVENRIEKEKLEQLIKEKNEFLKELKKLGRNSDFYRELSELSLLLIEMENYNEAEKNYLLSLEFFKKKQDRIGQAAVLGVLGILYFKKNDFLKAIENYKKANEIYEELKQYPEYITCLKGIGNSYIKLNQFERGSEIYFKCSTICSEQNDIENFLDCLGNLIFIYETQENWEVVRELYFKSLDAFKKLKDNKGIIVSYFNLGILGKKLENYAKALDFFKRGIKIATDSNYLELKLKGLFYIGECLIFLRKSEEAKNKFIETLYLAKKLRDKNTIIQIKILLKSIGLSNYQIKEELEKYKRINKN